MNINTTPTMKKKQTKEDNPQPRKSDLVMNLVANIGLILIVVGAAMPLFHGPIFAAQCVYATGAALTLIGRLFAPYRGDNIRVRRLFSMQIFAALAFVVAAFFMFYDQSSPNDWIAFTIVGALLQIYASFMIQHIEKKNEAAENDAKNQK